MFHNYVLRFGRVLLSVFLVALFLPSFVYAQTPASLTGTGYSVGDTPYDFTALDQDGNQVSLYQYYGRYTILAYDAVWCPPSHLNGEQLGAAVAQFAAEGLPLQALTVLIDGLTEGVASTQSDAINWYNRYKTVPVLHMNGSYDPTIIEQFQAYSIPNGGEPSGAYPTLVILNPYFKIIYVQAGAIDANQYRQIILDDLNANLVTLKDMIIGGNLDAGINQSLSVQVDNAIAALNKSNYQLTHKLLDALLNQINAQTGKKLPSDLAASLADQIDLLNAGLGY